MATPPPNKAPNKMVGRGGNFRIAIRKTTANGISASGVILNEASRVVIKISIMFPFDSALTPKPIIKKIINAKIMEGPVVQTICRICVKRSVPVTAGARLVVSDKGDILSPKYAPEMIAPAVIAGERSSPIDTPINATPSVPATVQELPVARAAIAQIKHVAG